MADEPVVNIEYAEGCGDCGKRRVDLPAALPQPGDDFDWDVRDYDGYRLFMLEELAARFPERPNWTPADMEVVLVEALAVVLDQLSDMNDRIQAESYLHTARKPDTVRRLLQMIGYDPKLHIDRAMLARIKDPEEMQDYPDIEVTDQELETLWRYYPHLMQEAKHKGPRSIHQQRRMVTLEDYRNQLLAHPLVLDVDAYSRWSGSWHTHYVALRLINNLKLDDILDIDNIVPHFDNPDQQIELYQSFTRDLISYYQQQEIEGSEIPDIEGRSSRFLIQDIIKRQRLTGQEVILQDATLVGIVLSISIRLDEDFYRSEIDAAVRAALLDPGAGLFAPGNLKFGEDVVASDIIEVLMALDGVESVCLNRMKRIGSIFADQSGTGRIVLQGHEVAVLEDDVTMQQHGSLKLTLHGGKPG